MIVYRLSNAKYINDLSGTGAKLFGGRWNSRGVSMLYTSASIALATVEIAVRTPLFSLPENFFLITIFIPDNKPIYQLSKDDLPENWDDFPHGDESQQIGDQFLEDKKYLIMKAPSASVKGEFNYLINPQHADFSEIKVINIEPFEFDTRLFY